MKPLTYPVYSLRVPTTHPPPSQLFFSLVSRCRHGIFHEAPSDHTPPYIRRVPPLSRHQIPATSLGPACSNFPSDWLYSLLNYELLNLTNTFPAHGKPSRCVF